MNKTKLNLSEYRAMWLFAMFDLPAVEPEERREYARFRKELLTSVGEERLLLKAKCGGVERPRIRREPRLIARPCLGQQADYGAPR